MQFSTWMHPKQDDFKWKSKLAELAEIGILRIFYEGTDLEQLLKAAKDFPIEIHKWQWIVNRPDANLHQTNPELFMVNKLGENCAINPPYVNYYRWLCPNNSKALEEILKPIKYYKKYSELSGIHLDYIRFPDIFLPVGLQPKYNLDQDREMPQFDFCYCDYCLKQFKEKYDLNARNLESEEEIAAWFQFRLDTISNLVNRVKYELENTDLHLTAAVFPSPTEAARAVRQDWRNWPLDAAIPMLYHKFYNENISWIGEMISRSIIETKNQFPIHAGIYLPELETDDFSKILEIVKQNEATGISLFPADQLSKEIKEIIRSES
ncbi:MAG: hypothetical protein K9N09_11030 [Candidatus Cloacimonetes bacterium]|nr:hypothetical protein [Candidatus Cloacimonadota bacterium]MCF7815141.1 hypothetical protein [Candidatus Cloacimonadota bacterium]MCF7869220.1 hypothetical protein [Candidatus Cloacimonadota bacterium]MCF7884760.1 hypothetical protein [Candidatus Cloacimonadota bacterium]